MGNENSLGHPEDLSVMKKYQGFTIEHIMMIKLFLKVLLSITKGTFRFGVR